MQSRVREPKVPQPVKIFNASNKFVLPEPLGPEIKFIPGPQLKLLLFIFLKLFIKLDAINNF